MSFQTRRHAHRDRASYYRAEAARVAALAAATPTDAGRGGFETASQQYRNLADAFDRMGASEKPMMLGAAVVRSAADGHSAFG